MQNAFNDELAAPKGSCGISTARRLSTAKYAVNDVRRPAVDIKNDVNDVRRPDVDIKNDVNDVQRPDM